MNLVNTFCLAKYYSTFDSTELLNRVQQQIDSNITSLSREFLFVFHRVLYTDPCYFWDKKVFTQTLAQLESLAQAHGNPPEIDEPIFKYFLMGYDSYCQVWT